MTTHGTIPGLCLEKVVRNSHAYDTSPWSFCPGRVSVVFSFHALYYYYLLSTNLYTRTTPKAFPGLYPPPPLDSCCGLIYQKSPDNGNNLKQMVRTMEATEASREHITLHDDMLYARLVRITPP